jgi:hypothetical protein
MHTGRMMTTRIIQQSVNINQSINQPINQLINQSINELMVTNGSLLTILIDKRRSVAVSSN